MALRHGREHRGLARRGPPRRRGRVDARLGRAEAVPRPPRRRGRRAPRRAHREARHVVAVELVTDRRGPAPPTNTTRAIASSSSSSSKSRSSRSSSSSNNSSSTPPSSSGSSIAGAFPFKNCCLPVSLTWPLTSKYTVSTTPSLGSFNTSTRKGSHHAANDSGVTAVPSRQSLQPPRLGLLL